MSLARTIGIITHTFDGIFHTPLIRAIHKHLIERGYRLLMVHGTIEEVVKNRLATEHVAGWLTILNDVQTDQLQRLGKPIVLISGQAPDIPSILADNQGGTIAAIEHLLAHGHRRIAFAGYHINFDFRERHTAYEATLRAQGIAVRPELTIDIGSYDVYDAYHKFRTLLTNDLQFDAVFCANDWLAFGVIQALKEAHKRIPDDISVIGFDDIPEAAFTIPALTSVRQDPVAAGVTAAEMLLGQIEEGITPPMLTRLPTKLIIRNSTRARNDSELRTIKRNSYRTPYWQAQLTSDLIQFFTTNQQGMQSQPLTEELHAGITTLVSALAAVLAGKTPLPIPTTFWQFAISTMHFSELRSQFIETMRFAGVQQISVAQRAISLKARVFPPRSKRKMSGPKQNSLPFAHDPQMLDRVTRWLFDCSNKLEHQFHVLHVNQTERDRARFIAEGVLQSRIGETGDSPRLLDWMSHSYADWGMLGLWESQTDENSQTSEDRGRLSVSSVYVRAEGAIPTSLAIPAQQFPPLSLLPQAIQDSLEYIIKLTPVFSNERHWGFLAFAERFLWTFNDITKDRNAFLATALELEWKVTELRKQSIHDSLTGLHNRHFLTEIVPPLLEEFRFDHQPLSLAVLDVDNFKQINDTFSHRGGDYVLITLAQLMRTRLRMTDILIRLGGEEFALILPKTKQETAIEVCEQLRISIEQFVWEKMDNELQVTISIGFAMAQTTDTLDTLLHRADTCLYIAKRQGKNQVVVSA